jgi:hypothetical protein
LLISCQTPCITSPNVTVTVAKFLDLAAGLFNAIAELQHLLVRQSEIVPVAGERAIVLDLVLQLLDRPERYASNGREPNQCNASAANSGDSGSLRRCSRFRCPPLRHGKRILGNRKLGCRDGLRLVGCGQAGRRNGFFDRRRGNPLGRKRKLDLDLARSDCLLDPGSKARDRSRLRASACRSLGQLGILHDLDDPEHVGEGCNEATETTAAVLERGQEPARLHRQSAHWIDAHRDLLGHGARDVGHFHHLDPRRLARPAKAPRLPQTVQQPRWSLQPLTRHRHCRRRASRRFLPEVPPLPSGAWRGKGCFLRAEAVSELGQPVLFGLQCSSSRAAHAEGLDLPVHLPRQGFASLFRPRHSSGRRRSGLRCRIAEARHLGVGTGKVDHAGSRALDLRGFGADLRASTESIVDCNRSNSS